MADISVKEQISEKAGRIDHLLESFLPPEEGYEATVYRTMKYSLMAGGKRLRPMLMYETFRTFGGDGKVIEPFMAAIEMIHTYSLIHDDLPALDNDDYRRGRLTSHKVFGEAQAILAGDALLNYAYELASKAVLDFPECRGASEALYVLARKPGVSGMIGGQVVDVELTGRPVTADQLAYIYRCKTGALIEASMMIGALLAGAGDSEVKACESIGESVGLAFQIQDDILDITSDSSVLGKPVGSDEKNDKYTYATIHGLDAAKDRVRELSRKAVSDLDALRGSNPFLRELIISLVDREK